MRSSTIHIPYIVNFAFLLLTRKAHLLCVCGCVHLSLLRSPMLPSLCDVPAAMCPITQEIMEDPVVCADGHSYERSAITHWLLTRDTSPSTNTPLAHRNVMPNFALRNLIAEVRGVRRPVTFEQHLTAARPCAPDEICDDATGPAAAAVDDAVEPASASAPTANAAAPDEETEPAPTHAAESSLPIQPLSAVCRRRPEGGRPVCSSAFFFCSSARPSPHHKHSPVPRLLPSPPRIPPRRCVVRRGRQGRMRSTGRWSRGAKRSNASCGCCLIMSSSHR